MVRSFKHRVVGTAAALLMAGMVLVAAPPAHAATITVAPGVVDVNADAICSLREAVDNANNDNNVHPECAAGAGNDTISIPAGTYLLGPGGQLTLTDTDGTTLAGAGAATTFLDGGTTTRVLEVSAGTVTISGLTITNGGGVDSGAGILNKGDLTVTGSTLTGNTASCSGDQCLAGGGIINTVGGTVTVTKCTLSTNTASCSAIQCSSGGGIFILAGTVNVTNSTLSANTASCSGIQCSSGGGIFILAGTVNVTNSTLSANTASCSGIACSSGNGILNEGPTAVTLVRTIVVHTVSGNCLGTVSDGGSNLSFPGACGAITASPVPLLVDPVLQDNGGPTFTHALLPGSPAIDAAGNCNPPITTDQRGVPRPQGPACDIGAFEVVVAGGGGGGGGGGVAFLPQPATSRMANADAMVQFLASVLSVLIRW